MARFTILEWLWMAALGLAGSGLYALHIKASRPLEIITIIVTGVLIAALAGPALHDAVLPAFAKGDSSLTAVGFASGYLGMLLARYVQKWATAIAPDMMARMGLDVQRDEGDGDDPDA